MPNALEFIAQEFPWINQIGISPSQLQTWVVDLGLSGDALLSKVREDPAYKAMFPGIRRPDGTLRASEQTYQETVDSYRQVLRQFSQPGTRFDDPADFEALWNNEIDPGELRDRLTIYDRLETAGQDMKDAYFVYGGINLSTDDLYRALQDGGEADRITRQYNEAVSNSPLDYDTWVTRASQASLNRVVGTLERLEADGVATGNALSAVRQIDPQFARQMTDVLLHGGEPGNTAGFLGLTELTEAFQLALIGSAASEQGFALPSIERIRAIRDAGVDRAAAMRGFSTFAQSGDRLQSQIRRLRKDPTAQFGVEDFEKAAFLQSAPEQELLRRAGAKEDSFGRANQGAGTFSRGSSGQLEQSGFVAP